MESELKGLNSKPAKQDRNDGPASKDDRPLLKPDPASSVSAEELQELEKKCAACVRRDVYGTMGRGELPVKEKVLLGLAMVTLVPIRVVLATTLLVLFLICQICTICTLFKVPNRDEQEQEDYAHMRGWRRTVIVQCGRTLSRAMLFVFGFYWINEPYRIPSDSEPKQLQGHQVLWSHALQPHQQVLRLCLCSARVKVTRLQGSCMYIDCGCSLFLIVF